MTILNKMSLSLILKILTFIVAFLSSVIVSRELGPQNFGIYRYIIVLVSTSYIISEIGVFESVNQSLASKRMKTSEAFMFNLIWGIIITILLLIVTVVYRVYAADTFLAGWKLYLAFIYMILYFSDNSISNILKGSHKINEYNILSTSRVFLVFISIFFLRQFSLLKLETVLIVNIIVWIIYYFSALYFLKPLISKFWKTRFTKGEIGKIFRRGFIIQLSNLSTFLNYRADVFILKIYQPFSVIGIYSIAVSLVEKLWIIPEALRDIVYLEIVAKRKDEKFLCQVSRFSFTFLSLFSIILGLLAKYIIPFIYTEKYIDSVLPLIIILPGVVSFSISKLLGAYFFAKDKTHYNTYTSIIAFIVNVTLNFVLIPYYGIIGAAVATFISYTLGSFIHLYLFTKSTKTRVTDMLVIRKSDMTMVLNRFRQLIGAAK